ncbi:uncharacterized protein LOC128218283 isoform X2 [Mya arenaria]|nr:uncharacterized protein LOC128218283 isoform X2 [Mya arenaria]
MPIQMMTTSLSREGEKISSFKDIFTCEDNTTTDIYIYGSPGVGKTTLCKKIVLEWCYRMRKVFEDQKTTTSQGETGLQQQRRHRHAFTDVDFLDKFDFILPIFLHRSQGFCDVDEMIKHLVVDNFSKSSFYTQEFLQRILDEKKCLVILDGLDEWKHLHECLKGHSDIPHRKTRGRCTILTTTRYENLTVTESSPRYEMQMKGFDTETSELLIERVFRVVDGSRKGLNNFQHMTGLMKTNETRHMFANPTMLMQVIGLCLESGPICKSRCEVYSTMLAILLDNTESKHRETLDMKRLENTDQYRKLSLPQQMLENKILKKYHNFVIMLAEFAFQITLGRQDTFCFDELLCEELKLPPAVLNIARVSGIFIDVTDHKSKIQSMTFMDKSYQAFFCAIYVCSLPQAIENVIERDTAITTQSFDQINRNFASLLGAVEMPLVFAAGLNVESHRYICDALSPNLEDTLLRHLNVAEYVHSFIAFLQNVQVFNKCIVSANEESIKNQSQRPYHIQHIASAGWKFKTDMKKASDLKNNVKTVLLHDVSLDNSNYKRLIAKEPNIHTIWLNGVNMSEMQELHLPGNVQRILLNNCILPIAFDCDFSNYKDVTFFQAHILSECITIPNSSLEVCIVKYTRTAAAIEFYPFTSLLKVLQLSDVILNSSLDLSICINLNSMQLDNVQFEGQLKVNTSQLEECVLKKLSNDISTKVCSILMSATNLKKLQLSDLEMDHKPRTACVTKLFYCCSGQTHLNLSRASKICDLSMNNLKVTKISINGTALQRCSLSDLRASKIQFTTSFGTMLQTYHISNLSETLCQDAFQYLDPSHVQTIRIAESPCQAMMIERINHMSNAEEIHMTNIDISKKCLKFPQRVRVIRLESLVVDNNSELVIPSSTEIIELICIENVPFIDLKNAKLHRIAIRSSSISREVLETFVQEISEMGIEVECIFDACALEDANSGTLNFRYHNEAWHMTFICCRSEILPTIISVTDKIDTIKFDNVGDKDNRLIETSGCGGLRNVSEIEIANCSNLDQFCNVLKDTSRLKSLAFENMNLTDYVFQGVESTLNRTTMLTSRTYNMYLTPSIRHVYLSNCMFTEDSFKTNVFNIFLMAQRVKFTLVESSIRIDDNDTETYRVMKCTINNTRKRKFLNINEIKYGPWLQNLLCNLDCLTHLEIHEMDLEKTKITLPNGVRSLNFDHCEMSKDSLIILNDSIEDLSFKWVLVVRILLFITILKRYVCFIVD